MSNKQSIGEHIAETIEKGQEDWAGLLTFLFIIFVAVAFVLNFVKFAIIIGVIFSVFLFSFIYWYLNGLFTTGCERLMRWWIQKFPPEERPEIEHRSEYDYF